MKCGYCLQVGSFLSLGKSRKSQGFQVEIDIFPNHLKSEILMIFIEICKCHYARLRSPYFA